MSSPTPTEQVRRARVERGLPERINDPATLLRVARTFVHMKKPGPSAPVQALPKAA